MLMFIFWIYGTGIKINSIIGDDFAAAQATRQLDV